MNCFLKHWVVMAMALMLMITPHAVASGHISVIYGKSPLDSLLGVAADYEKDFGSWDLEADAQLQDGDITESEAHIALGFDVGPVQLKPFLEINAIKTYEDWGYARDGGAKVNVPIGQSGVEAALGVFFRGSQAFVPLQKGTRNTQTGEIVWDEASVLNFDGLGLVNALFEVNFEWRRIDIGVSGIFDISNKSFHQVIVDAGTSWQLTEKLSIGVDGQYVEQPGEGGGRQTSATIRSNYKF